MVLSLPLNNTTGEIKFEKDCETPINLRSPDYKRTVLQVIFTSKSASEILDQQFHSLPSKTEDNNNSFDVSLEPTSQVINICLPLP